MEKEEIKTKLLEIIKKHHVEMAVENETNIRELGIDSLDLVEIVMDIEDCFNIEFYGREILDVTNFESLIDTINKKISD